MRCVHCDGLTHVYIVNVYTITCPSPHVTTILFLWLQGFSKVARGWVPFPSVQVGDTYHTNAPSPQESSLMTRVLHS